MEITIFWTDFSKTALQKIFSYYKENASINVAKNLVLAIVGKTTILKTHPNIGAKEELLKERKENFRYLLFKNYKIIYWINMEKNRIEIADVFDTRQNPVKMRKLKQR
jgi:plasmid stabilization system protein ParE